MMIRFQRIGRANDPAFRIVVLEKERAAQSNRIVEQVGTYNPKSKAVTLDAEAIKGWIAKGAQATGSVHNLLLNKGVIEGKKVNVLPKKTYTKPEEPVAEAAPAPAAPAAEPAPEVAEAPTEAEVVAEAIPEAAPEVATETPAEEPAAA